MPAETTPAPPLKDGRRDFFVVSLCLAAVLALLFHKSFTAGQVLFSNDGPLGAVRSQAGNMWSNLLGTWQDLNWIGNQYPSMALDVSGLLLAICGDTSPDFGS